jgi:hypothetical protein
MGKQAIGGPAWRMASDDGASGSDADRRRRQHPLSGLAI